MLCQNCGKEIGDSDECAYCGFGTASANVREMSEAETFGYDGTTIDQNGGGTHEPGISRDEYRQRKDPRIFFEGIQLGHSGNWLDKILQSYWLSRLFAGLVVAAIVTLLVFVALPIVLAITAIGMIVWLVIRFLHP